MLPVHAQVTIDLEVDSEPITGSFQRAEGGSTMFSGWIQLVSLLQSAATSPAPPAPATDPPSNGDPHRLQSPKP
jgi:hypothetical protein